jgi:hypothetical protein
MALDNLVSVVFTDAELLRIDAALSEIEGIGNYGSKRQRKERGKKRENNLIFNLIPLTKQPLM